MHAERGEVSLGPLVAMMLLAGVIATLPIFLIADRREHALEASEQTDLRNAMSGAQLYFVDRGSFSGFTPQVAEQYEPSAAFTTGASAPGRISIRGVTDSTIVMVTESGSGAVLCVAATHDLVTYGRVDTSTASSCFGGW